MDKVATRLKQADLGCQDLALPKKRARSGSIAMAMNLAPVHRHLNIMRDAIPLRRHVQLLGPVLSQAACIPTCTCSVLTIYGFVCFLDYFRSKNRIRLYIVPGIIHCIQFLSGKHKGKHPIRTLTLAKQ